MLEKVFYTSVPVSDQDMALDFYTNLLGMEKRAENPTPDGPRFLGFAKEWEHQFEPGFPLFVSVARGSVRLYLSEHKGDARPDTLIHLYVNDIDAVSEEFGIPVDEAGLAGRECDPVDPDGNRLRIATRRS